MYCARLQKGTALLLVALIYNSFAIAQTPDPKAGVLHIIALGIDDYKEERLKLRNAVADAKAIAREFKQRSRGLYSEIKTTMLINRAGTAQRLNKAFNQVAKALRKNDTFVLFVAGHGYTENDESFYFIPQDFSSDKSSYEKGAIGPEMWGKWIQSLPEARIMFIFDVCESAALIKHVAFLSRDRVTLIAAAPIREQAFEDYHGHGALTYSILDAFAHAPREKGVVKMLGFFSHISDKLDKVAVEMKTEQDANFLIWKEKNIAIIKD
jgi:uncharacterized caspase-like protein